ncbi:scavenger receptor class B member 1 isoform X2 [Chrysoperla carnea]|uniref:scavenger receptor class B member 1 isoform X2 n=1 Tax=Chrysoperla carnea TaxID=189513 RepID=UPI001D07527D|nr:scavenger receptor class B member 1 isoform X2 [Chrysoperla carnea]
MCCTFSFTMHNTARTFMFLLLGLLGILSGCFFLMVHPYELIFNWKVQFSEGSEIYELWRKPPVNLYLRVYLFNVTNAEAFLRGDEKLRVEEVGPYVYEENLEHVNVTFNDNGTLSTIPKHPLVWRPDLSQGRREDDILILPHIALLSITHVMHDASYFTRLGLNLLIRQTKTEPLVAMTAKEFMFGYESSLVTLGNNVMPNWISFDKLGLIDRMYFFEGDYETVYTGESNIKHTGLIDTYRGSRNLPQWPEEHCSNVNLASDGTKFLGGIEEGEELLFYRKSLCRAAPLVLQNKTEINGLTSWQYTFKDNILDNGEFIKENKCFCRNGNCFRRGLIDVTDCYYGFPIALSYPHFWDSDPSLVEEVEGSYPDQHKHQTFFHISPDSGLPLNISVKFQINMALGPIAHMAHVERFANMVLPLLWFDIHMYELPEPLNNRFKLYLNYLPVAEKMGMYASFFSGIFFIVTVIYKLLYSNRAAIAQNHKISKNKQHHWLDQNMTKSVENRLNDYIKVERRNSMTNKELEIYYNGLVTPLNQDIAEEDFANMKEDIV